MSQATIDNASAPENKGGWSAEWENEHDINPQAVTVNGEIVVTYPSIQAIVGDAVVSLRTGADSCIATHYDPGADKYYAYDEKSGVTYEVVTDGNNFRIVEADKPIQLPLSRIGNFKPKDNYFFTGREA